mmetsp:Transcript_2889/g.3684  ORF Transcript_2889/g.3684 Transcript_2889/m.3684 type:complete len:123 (+) Transcript_2889:1-369(+)
MFTMAILLLNFIIAVLNDSYNSVKISEEAQALLEKAKIILELQNFLPTSHIEQIEKELRWIHVLMPQEWGHETSLESHFQHLTDRIDQLEKQQDTSLQKLTKQQENHFQNIMKKLNAIEAKE